MITFKYYYYYFLSITINLYVIKQVNANCMWCIAESEYNITLDIMNEENDNNRRETEFC